MLLLLYVVVCCCMLLYVVVLLLYVVVCCCMLLYVVVTYMISFVPFDIFWTLWYFLETISQIKMFRVSVQWNVVQPS